MPSPDSRANPFPDGEMWLQALADSAPVLIWSSGRDGLCTYFNKRWLQFTGRTQEESLGEGWVEDVHPEDRNRVLEEYRRAFQAREKFRLEYRLRRQHREYKWIVDFGSPVFSPGGNFLGYIGSCMDTDTMQNDVRETRWRQKYEAVLTALQLSDYPERIAAAEVAIRDRLQQVSDPEEQIALGESLARVLALKER
jgi:PAS domain S-box-containing protein